MRGGDGPPLRDSVCEGGESPRAARITGWLQEFDVTAHLLGGQDLPDQHQPANEVTHRSTRSGVDNPGVRYTFCVQSEKVRILGNNNASLLVSPLHMPAVLCAEQACLVHGQHIRATIRRPRITAPGTCSSV